MKKLKIPILILVTLALLLFFALLPKLFSFALDMRLSQMPKFSEMLSIQLNTGTQPQAFSALDKLAFLSVAEVTDTSQDQMTMNEDEVTDAVSAFMSQCEAAGIFQPFEPSTVSMQPKLHYDLKDPSKHMFVWFVTILYKKEPNQVLRLDVDDETGQILCITYGNYQEYSMEGVWERNKTVLDAFTDIYFTQLGIMDTAEEVESTVTNAESIYDYNEVDGGVTEAVYVFRNSLDDEFIIQFTVDGAGGFSNSILK